MNNSCLYCDKIINNKGSLASHQNRCYNNPNRVEYKRSHKAGTQKGNIPWNKGLKGEYSDGHLERLRTAATGRKHTAESKEKISVSAKQRGLGGYTKGGGRGKSGWYKGIWCDSSWELAYVIYCIDNDIKLVKNNKKFQYNYNGKKLFYIPDFILEDGTYIEIKGYRTEQWDCKISQFNYPIKVLYKEDIKIYLDYAKMKFGKDYIKVYER